MLIVIACGYSNRYNYCTRAQLYMIQRPAKWICVVSLFFPLFDNVMGIIDLLTVVVRYSL